MAVRKTKVAHHTKYWSCTPFADWVRGTPKGGAKTGEGWDTWEEEAKRYNPVRYWIAEEALDHVQDFKDIRNEKIKIITIGFIIFVLFLKVLCITILSVAPKITS